mmetsp:Transcript_97982/g.299504  ORF Transcript_97982/g.299504 Transcript_97982/m.299504 type:complete len:355 (-) Transcript_97982:829-1893(-)
MVSDAILESMAGGNDSAWKASLAALSAWRCVLLAVSKKLSAKSWKDAARRFASAAARRFASSPTRSSLDALDMAVPNSFAILASCAAPASRRARCSARQCCNWASWRPRARARPWSVSSVPDNVIHRQPCARGRPPALVNSTEAKSVEGNPLTTISIVYKWYMVLMPLKEGDSSMSTPLPSNRTDSTLTSLAARSANFGGRVGSIGVCTSVRWTSCDSMTLFATSVKRCSSKGTWEQLNFLDNNLLMNFARPLDACCHVSSRNLLSRRESSDNTLICRTCTTRIKSGTPSCRPQCSSCVSSFRTSCNKSCTDLKPSFPHCSVQTPNCSSQVCSSSSLLKESRRLVSLSLLPSKR